MSNEQRMNRSLRFSKCLKTTVELTFTTQKANARSPWTTCFVFDCKCVFGVNLVQKLKTQNAEFNGDAHFFCFRLGIPCWANFVQKIKIVSLS